MNQPKKYFCISAIVTFLLGCQSVPPQPTHVIKALDKAIDSQSAKVAPKPLTKVPNAVQQELMQHSMQQARKGL